MNTKNELLPLLERLHILLSEKILTKSEQNDINDSIEYMQSDSEKLKEILKSIHRPIHDKSKFGMDTVVDLHISFSGLPDELNYIQEIIDKAAHRLINCSSKK